MPENIVVIGGGLGGMAAGVALSKKGFDVTLIEEQPHLGGYAIAFRRDEFVFDLALHSIPAGIPGAPFYEIIRQLGMENDITFLKLKEAFNIHLGDYVFQMPNDLEELFDRLTADFPAEKDGLVNFRKDLWHYAPLYFRIVEGGSDLKEILFKFIPKIPLFLKHTTLSTEEYLSGFFRDVKLKSILYHASIFFGIPMKEFPAINFMLMFYMLFSHGMFTIKGGGQALTNVLVKHLQKNGVGIITKTRVKKVNIKNNRVDTVRAADGTEYKAKVVISNVNTPVLVKELIGESSFPESYIARLNTLKPSLSVVLMHMGLDCETKKLGINNHISLFYPDDDIDTYMGSQQQSDNLKLFSILAPGITDPQKESNNERIISVLAGVSAKHWLNLPENKYMEQKQKCIEHILFLLDQRYPDLSSHIKTIDLATPHTFNRYTANPDGAILGFDCSLGMHREMMKVTNIPIKNLFLANAWTSKLGGFMSSMKAGLKAAKKAESTLARPAR